MVRAVATLAETLDGIEGVVLDQWGVLHDGSAPYPFAVPAVAELKRRGLRLATLSNSGKRADTNADQLARIGFDVGLFDVMMTSGEALRRDFQTGKPEVTRLFPIARAPGDAEAWAQGLGLDFVPIEEAEAVLLMGWPEGARDDLHRETLATARARALPLLCANPDRAAPRPDGALALAPGAIAHEYAAQGGDVRFSGKPGRQVFRAVEQALALPPEKLLMVGDSLEHDIAGAAAAGWRSVFIRGGLHARHFRTGDIAGTITALARDIASPLPTFTLDILR